MGVSELAEPEMRSVPRPVWGGLCTPVARPSKAVSWGSEQEAQWGNLKALLAAIHGYATF